MNKLHRDTFQTLLARVPVLIITFFHTIILIRLLGKEGNGVYAFLIANAHLGNALLSINLKQAFTYFIAQRQFPPEKIIGLALYIVLIGTFVFSAFSLLTFHLDAPWLSILTPKGYSTLFSVLFLIFYFFFFLLAQGFCHSLLRGNLKFRIFNLYMLLSNVLILIILGGLFILKTIYNYSFTVENILQIILVTQLVITLIYLLVTIWALKLKIDVKFNTLGILRAYFTYAMKGYFTQIAGFLTKRIDVWFVEFFRGVATLGVYALAGSFINFMLEAFLPINQVLMPYLTKLDKKEGGAILIRYVRLTFFLALIMVLVIFVIAGWIIPFLFGQTFEASVLPVRILVFGVIFIALQQTFVTFVAAHDQLHHVLKGNVYGLIATIVLDLLLIPQHGIIGASIASIFSYFVSSFYLMVRVMKDIKQPIYTAFIFNKSDWNYWKEQFGGK